MDRIAGCMNSKRPIVTKIANKFQITVPGEIRAMFDLREGDCFEWTLNEENLTLTLTPKRPQLITPLLHQQVLAERAERAKSQTEKPAKLSRKAASSHVAARSAAVRNKEESQILQEA